MKMSVKFAWKMIVSVTQKWEIKKYKEQLA